MSEFDHVAADYRHLTSESIAASGEGVDFFAEYKARDLAAWAAHRPGGQAAVRSLLDFGCGVGTGLAFLRAQFPGARVHGADPSPRSVALARAVAQDEGDVVAFDGLSLPHADASFDAVFAACVFHHIEPAQRDAALAEIRRVLRPGGFVFIYEHNPANPLTVRAVKACPYDEGVELLPHAELRDRVARAGFAAVESRYRVFFPRALAWLRPLERFLVRLPLGAQYFVAGERPG
jgi:SAM-dependent methyltransferase